jgi:hypothetical protein
MRASLALRACPQYLVSAAADDLNGGAEAPDGSKVRQDNVDLEEQHQGPETA